MKRVFLVSYPRSGQHYTQRLLERVTGSDDYCELYNCAQSDCPGKALPVAQRSPCLAGRRFQKSHDFDLQLPYSDDFLYVALYRRPMFSITSYFELDTREGKGVPFKNERGKKFWKPESVETWESYAIDKASYWRDFVRKWVPLSGNGNVLAVRYEEIVRDIDVADAFFRFVFPSFDEERLASAMQQQRDNLEQGRNPSRTLLDFRHPISDQLVDRIRQVIEADTLTIAGYPDVL